MLIGINQGFDERQIQLRKNAFQHGFLTFVVLLVLNAFLTSYLGFWTDGLSMNILMFWIGTDVAFVEMIAKDAYAPNFALYLFMGIILGVVGTALMVYSIWCFILSGQVVEAGRLTEEFSDMLQSIGPVIPGIACLVRCIRMRLTPDTN